jgi:hypothetical protein
MIIVLQVFLWAAAATSTQYSIHYYTWYNQWAY